MSKFVKQLGDLDRKLHKIEIEDLATKNINAIIESRKYDLLTVYVELKRYETYLKKLVFELKPLATIQAKENGKKTFEHNQAKINLASRTKWDYSVDKEWLELDTSIKRLSSLKKIREFYLKENHKLEPLIDRETGEILDDFKLPKEITYGLTIRL